MIKPLRRIKFTSAAWGHSNVDRREKDESFFALETAAAFAIANEKFNLSGGEGICNDYIHMLSLPDVSSFILHNSLYLVNLRVHHYDCFV